MKAKAIALAAAMALLPSVAWAAAEGIGGPVDPSIKIGFIRWERVEGVEAG